MLKKVGCYNRFTITHGTCSRQSIDERGGVGTLSTVVLSGRLEFNPRPLEELGRLRRSSFLAFPMYLVTSASRVFDSRTVESGPSISSNTFLNASAIIRYTWYRSLSLKVYSHPSTDP